MVLMKDGFPTIVVVPGAGLTFEEIEVTPPGTEGGGPIDLTTMRSVGYRPQWPKSLAHLTGVEVLVGYDPAFLAVIDTNLQVVYTMGVIFPDGQQISFTGWIESFKPNPCKEGERPTGMLKIELTGLNISNLFTFEQVAEEAEWGGSGGSF